MLEAMNRLTAAAKFGTGWLAFAFVGVAAVPTITSAAPVDIFHKASSSGDVSVGHWLVSTGSPTKFEADGHPSGATPDAATLRLAIYATVCGWNIKPIMSSGCG